MNMWSTLAILLAINAQAHGKTARLITLNGQPLVEVLKKIRPVEHGTFKGTMGSPPDQALLVTSTIPGPGGVGKLPALGFNSWNAYHCQINEDHFLNAAKLMVELGLTKVGYEYVNIDDCWSEKSRDPITHRLNPDLSKFPDGIHGTAEKIHSLGLKIGIYSSAGTATCAGYPASLGYEDIDAQTWAEWGIDYLKYDNCNVPLEWQDECEWCVVDLDNHKSFTPGPNGTCPQSGGDWCPPGYDFGQSRTAERYRRMQRAINRTDRSILYSLCEWGTANVQSWGADVAQSWRSTGDIFPNWDRILEILNENSFYMNHVDFYAHSDADMLEVGNLPYSPTVEAETRSHFALWAAMKSPLLIGTDLSKLSYHDLDVLKNPYLLSFNQDDTYGKPAQPYKWGTNPDWTFDAKRPAEYWAGKSKIGTLVLVLNTDDSVSNKTIDFDEIPGLDGNKSYMVTDIWTGRVLNCIVGGIVAEISAHDTAAVIVGPEC
ncbi:uncharacterized protein PV09_08672 [Verruconis gallopava]|uniref:Alpha-galactosidase n=1 Tax=Verruconis gallopava TaxID=253628 RepID=A0A0D1ZZ89_9PEZI|nr:uncharacterized protein PV09_08672 [Verruconis gallopava]KIV99752.1 hypothetical protein PV09_08672 [Verruconis gallopava]